MKMQFYVAFSAVGKDEESIKNDVEKYIKGFRDGIGSTHLGEMIKDDCVILTPYGQNQEP